MASRHLVLALFVLLLGVPAAAQNRVLVVREDAPALRQTAESLARELAHQGRAVSEVLVGPGAAPADLRREGEQVLVALGLRAFALVSQQSAGRPVVAAMLSRSAFEELLPVAAERWTAILLDQPLDRWLNLIHIAFPGIEQVGALLGPGQHKQAAVLERRFADRRLSLAIEAIGSPEDVVPALERLLPRMELLLALPDSRVHNRNTVQPLLLTTYRAGVPVLAYSEAYQQAGAALALYSTPAQIARQVAEAVQQFAEGRPPPAIQPPRHFTVGVNAAVARSLGLRLPQVAELQQQLRNLDQ